MHKKKYKMMSKTNQIKVITLLILVLNLMFFFIPLDMHWDEVKEEFSPYFIYQNTEILIVHLTFLLCLILNYLIKIKIVYNVTAFILVIIAFLYFLFATTHSDSKSWYAVGAPCLVAFLPLVLYKIDLVRKLKD